MDLLDAIAQLCKPPRPEPRPAEYYPATKNRLSSDELAELLALPPPHLPCWVEEMVPERFTRYSLPGEQDSDDGPTTPPPAAVIGTLTPDEEATWAEMCRIRPTLPKLVRLA